MASKWLKILCCFFNFISKNKKHSDIVYQSTMFHNISLFDLFSFATRITTVDRDTRQTTRQHVHKPGNCLTLTSVQLCTCTEFKFSVYFNHMNSFMTTISQRKYVRLSLHLLANAKAQVDAEKNDGVEKSINLCWDHRKIFHLRSNRCVFSCCFACFQHHHFRSGLQYVNGYRVSSSYFILYQCVVFVYCWKSYSLIQSVKKEKQMREMSS